MKTISQVNHYFYSTFKNDRKKKDVLKEDLKMASDEDDLTWKYYTYYTHMQRESSIPLIYVFSGI